MISEKEKEFENIINRFTSFIRVQLYKFYPYRYGLDTDDLHQEIRIKIWKVLKNEKKIVNLASYIKKIINSTVIDQIRKIKREENIYNTEMGKKASEATAPYSYNPLHEKELRELIGHAVESLIDSRKRVVKLYLLNMSIDEIAEFYRWSKDKTRNLLYRGLADLKNKLKNIAEIDENPY